MKTLPNLRKFIQRHCFPVENKGQSAVLLIFLTIAFLVIVGISIDTANIFLKRSHLGRALDAAVMAAMTSYSSGVNDPEAIQTAAERMVAYNLKEMGIPSQDILYNRSFFEVQPDFAAKLTAKGDIRVPTLLVNLIGLQANIVSTSATAMRSPVAISLILDRSGSMRGNRIVDLKTAAIAFVNSFMADRDYMALITFNTMVKVEVPMAPVSHGRLTEKIRKISVGGSTNISEATVKGRLELEKMPRDMKRVIVFFTDGAPNVLRAIFEDGIPPLVPNYAFPPSSPTPNFYDYVVNADEEIDIIVHDPVTARELCSYDSSRSTGCFSSFAYLDSREVRYENQNITSVRQWREILKETYELAIIESDYAKMDGITIFTVGLGVESPIRADPFQDVIDDHIYIKPIFLRRVTGDRDSLNDVQFPGLEFTEMLASGGKYYQTSDSANLSDLFERIARVIKVRLVR